jgi:transposase-like protein
MTLVQTGVRESAQSWHELLIDIKQRGLESAAPHTAPALVPV